MEALNAYRWSSYRAYVGLEQKPEWLETGAVLGLVGGQQPAQPKQYQHYVEGALLEGAVESPWGRVQGQVVLGQPAFVESVEQWLKGDEQEQTGLKQLRRRPSWAEAVKVIEQMKGEKWEAFRERRGDWGRDVALWLGRMVCGLKLRQLAERAGLGHYGSVSTALRYLAARSARDPHLSRLMSQARSRLSNSNNA